ncbi:MAG: hypothetical protein O3A46_01805 [Candidatus Poribacteria bacterium]|nr:hypothetical protein [Candidatus Poribacteria bacterium]
MNAVTWFLVGTLSASLGAVAGSIVLGWIAWTASVLCGVIVGVVSRRLSSVVGSSLVAGLTGAVVVANPFLAALMAVLSVFAVAGGTVMAIVAANAMVQRVPAVPKRRAQPTAKPTVVPRPTAKPAESPMVPRTVPTETVPPALSARRIDELLALGARDPETFKLTVQTLTPAERRQVRDAFQARKSKQTTS